MSFKLFCLSMAIGSLLLSGCANKVYNKGFFSKDEPMFVDKVEPVPAPTPAPAPPPEPEPVMSVAQQNSQAMDALTALGFEAEESEQGVVVYLPPNIYFDSNASDINLDARNKIAEIAREVNKDYLLAREIEVSGHTDTAGSAELNMTTSKSRAEAATGELVFSKVALTRIKMTWFGEERPRVPEYDADGQAIPGNRALNRRVEFTILNPGN